MARGRRRGAVRAGLSDILILAADAVVAATALAAREKHHVAGCVILTGDPNDLRHLLSDAPGVRVVSV